MLCDRKFVGEQWVKFLNRIGIAYHIRIRENFYVTSPRTGKRVKASWLFGNLRYGQAQYHSEIFYVNNQLCYLSGLPWRRTARISLNFKLLYHIISPNWHKNYKERWQIETAFRGIKSSGFNIEDTHLTELDRLEKLFTLVMLAFAWAYVIRDYLDRYIDPIKIKAHERRAKSIFRHGLDFIVEILNNHLKMNRINVFIFLSCT